MSSSQSGLSMDKALRRGPDLWNPALFLDTSTLCRTHVELEWTPRTHTHIHNRENKTGFIFWEWVLVVLFIHSLCPRQSFGGTEHSDLPDYNWINSPPRKIIMEVWKWYTSNEANQHSFSVCAAKSHSGPTRWQRLESKANTALVLIKGLLLPLTGFNEELEVKDKQTNAGFASCSRPSLVPTSALIKDWRTCFKNSNISSAVFLLAVRWHWFILVFLQSFLCLTGQPISGGSQNSGEFVFLVIKVLCWVISSMQDRSTRGEQYTEIHTCTRRISVGGPSLPSAHGLVV